ncbi:MAG: ABC transporter ATP-binding protein [Candidatus Enterosoma sp.]|nr:ABC transporter ATP-binding protein/permease [Bacilli bacterium]MDD7181864.1 ABC transporter ATP-binding protein [Bacilli bacterium]MDY3046700.1 ABC transporter ATP-binding protein [Candidatus Enterosoma sp.]
MNFKKRFFSYLIPQKKLIVTVSVFVLIFLLSQLSQPFLVGKALNAALAGNKDSFLVIIIVCFALSLLGAIADFVFEYSVGIMTQKVIYEIRKDVYQKFNTVSIDTIFKEKHGDLVQLEIGDVENVANGLFSVFKSLIEGVLSVIITIIMMFTVNWILALGVILLSPLSILMSRFVAQFSHKYFKKQAKLQSDLNSISLEAIDNVDCLQSLNYQSRSIESFKNQDEELRKEGKIAQFSASWTNPTTRLVNNTIYAIIGIAGIIMIPYSSALSAYHAVMNIGNLSSFLSYTTQYTKPFNEISSVLSEYESAVFSFKRIDAFLAKEDDIDVGSEDVTDINEIQFKDMFFSYEKDQKLIEDFNETIHKGEKVAIVGPTGAGKSTLINVLMRFYDPTKGSVLYNGKEGTSIKKSLLRKNFGMVLQETWIFTGTIMDNVRYAKPSASDEEVISACKRAHADTFINTLPEGYNTKVSAKQGLSEGERQMLTIARVMLLEPDIVILDEATSNVDTRTEKLITDAFDRLLENKTSIVIAHRLSTIRNSDLILVLKDGHIIEQGSHNALMEKQGFYYSMYASQFR